MNGIFRDVEEWLEQRPLWLQDAAFRLFNNDSLTDKDLQELTGLCKAEAQLTNKKENYSKISVGSLSAKDDLTNLRIDSINNVRGISALSPRNPLNLSKSLTIVYGQNGSGKSSYVRLLKHISGSKKPGKLMGNVYSKVQQPQECNLTIVKNGEIREVVWTPEMGALDDLRAMQLYDTDCANVYVNEENEVAYEPWLLLFFSKLTNACLSINQILKIELDAITLTDLKYPNDYVKTSSTPWLHAINKLTNTQEIETRCLWTVEDENQLTNKNGEISETDPLEKVKHFKQVTQNIKTLHKLLYDAKSSLDESVCLSVIDAKLDYERKKRADEEDARTVFEGLPLEGIHSDSWKLLWEQARAYSEEQAYPNESFPNILEGANCVLCQQPLSTAAQERLGSFESYVKASLSSQAKSAEEHLAALLKKVKNVPTAETLELHFNSIGVISEFEKQSVLDFCDALQKRKESLIREKSLGLISSLPSEDIISALNESASANEEHATSFNELSKLENREEIKNNILELESRKWLHQNKNIIIDNVEKLRKKYKLEQAMVLTRTQALSTKKSSLTDLLITTEYVKRFQNELIELGGKRINVDLVKTRAQRGQIYHQIKLKDCPSYVRTSEVLSEGEFRIVSLAGFLADVEGGLDNTPFIFDDPISSLDQVFEEATVKRIAKLSTSRQVIVFTHRLSFLTLLEQAAKKLECEYNVTWLRSESWGSGEPGETPIFAKRPDKALNQILTERLPRAHKTLQEQGRIEYDLIAKGICSDFRVLIERIIENDLLGDVVQRFRRSVNTQGKLHKLVHISTEDCQLFEDYMTKYSTYEHSQSYETPVILPEPDELKEDMEKLKLWLGEFKVRTSV